MPAAAAGDRAVALFEPCEVELRVGNEAPIAASGWIANSIAGVGVGVLLGGVPPAVTALAERLRRHAQAAARAARAADPRAEPETDAAPVEGRDAGSAPPAPPAPRAPSPTVAARLDAMGATEKMRLALSGSRDERLALLRDINRVLHVYVLRNPRIALDEVQYASKQANLSPEALKLISEHPQWGVDPTVCGNLVRNPKTPTTIAIHLLDRISPSELRQIARGGARQAIVTAARRKLNI